jgi:Tfp pilus assembly protein PilF
LLAELQAVAGLTQDAESNFQAAIAADPNSIDARLAFGLFQLDGQAADQTRAAQEHLRKAKELDHRDLGVDMALIRLELSQEKLVDVINRLGMVLRADLPFARKRLPELLIGFSPDRLRRMIPAMEALANELRNDSGSLAEASVQALLYSANVELGAQQAAEMALQRFEQMTATGKAGGMVSENSYGYRLDQLRNQQLKRPLSVSESLEVAVLAWNLGQNDQALESLLTALRRGPNDQALYWLSKTCRALARETFQEAITRNPGSYRAHVLLADLANDNHDTARTLAEYEMALSAGGADPEVHLMFIQFLAARGSSAESLDKARIAVQKFPDHPGLNYELGKLLLKSGDAQQAISYFHRSLKADSTLVEARAELATAYAALGEFSKAVQQIKQVLSGDKDGSFHYRLGRWYQKIGQTANANAAFATATQLKNGRRETERSKLIRFEP